MLRFGKACRLHKLHKRLYLRRIAPFGLPQWTSPRDLGAARGGGVECGVRGSSRGAGSFPNQTVADERTPFPPEALVVPPKALRVLQQKEWIVDLEQKVIEIVSEKLSVPKEEITLESNFIDDLKADSLDLVEMVMAFEDSLGVSIPDEDQEKIRTVGDAVNYIRQKEKV